MAEDKRETWRCVIADCPLDEQWQAAPAGVTAEDCWERHLKVVHGGKTL